MMPSFRNDGRLTIHQPSRCPLPLAPVTSFGGFKGDHMSKHIRERRAPEIRTHHIPDPDEHSPSLVAQS
jgi:hypothetical protein